MSTKSYKLSTKSLHVLYSLRTEGDPLFHRFICIYFISHI